MLRKGNTDADDADDGTLDHSEHDDVILQIVKDRAARVAAGDDDNGGDGDALSTMDIKTDVGKPALIKESELTQKTQCKDPKDSSKSSQAPQRRSHRSNKDKGCRRVNVISSKGNKAWEGDKGSQHSSTTRNRLTRRRGRVNDRDNDDDDDGDLDDSLIVEIVRERARAAQEQDSSASRNWQQESRPGAVAVSGRSNNNHDDDDENSHVVDEEMDITLTFGDGLSNETVAHNRVLRSVDSLNNDARGMAVARALSNDDDTGTLDLPVAHEFDQHRKEQGRQYLARRRILCLGGSVLLVVAAISTATVFLLRRSSANSNDPITPTMPPTGAPSLSTRDYLLTLFPNSTLEALETYGSPQYQALDWMLEDANLYDYDDWRIRQRFALATFYYATGGPTSWSKNTDWLSDSKHECEWSHRSRASLTGSSEHFGLSGEPCQDSSNPNDDNYSRTGEVYKNLLMDENGLDGSLPLELFWLTSLKSISLSWNSYDRGASIEAGEPVDNELSSVGLRGSIPTDIALLTDLQDLLLGANRLEGEIPAVIFNMTSLRRLGLGYNTFQGTIASTISQLGSLGSLALNNNNLTGGVLENIARLSNLQNLALGSNAKFTGTIPTSLASLSSLIVLDLQNMDIGGSIPTELGLMTGLTQLDLAHQGERDQQSTIPTELGKLTLLEKLELDGSNLVGNVPSELGHCSVLQTLGLSLNDLTGSIPLSFAYLGNLKYFNVAGTRLSGTIPESLCEIKSDCIATDAHTDLLASFSGESEQPCQANNSPVAFDCSSILCGCNCSCAAGV